ncbi:hypothetical protein DOK67_0001425 [Enterococcus sp. DIV0212c]|uniref:LssY C-terminal domain-containing protein n=1 Tax=Enterococcus sp. DIV0212c TaxID=2230867 RepID=UPI001A9B77F9|nr:LssY C-terminal domain-containing protein [Enterococcus sp. DIV0212c]MBO1354367.1 LssY C-terminal domain-containing protein [Enterococcus sp. DIV0212c]
MKKQTVMNSIFRLFRFALIIISGYLVYKSLFAEILTKKIHIFAYVLLWLFSSYLILPFINKLMTGRYLPDYFIGRSRTSDGLLGDPINLAFIGTKEELEQLFLKAGWMKAEPLSLHSSLHMIIASVFGRSYPKAPVSSLFLFNKKQDLAFEKEIENNPRRRHHVRFWKTPENWYLPGGRAADWLGAATYDKKVGFSFFTGQVTHKINSDVDKERDFVLDTFKQTDYVLSIEIVEHFTTSYHGRNGGGDEIFTDGALPFIKIDR